MDTAILDDAFDEISKHNDLRVIKFSTVKALKLPNSTPKSKIEFEFGNGMNTVQLPIQVACEFLGVSYPTKQAEEPKLFGNRVGLNISNKADVVKKYISLYNEYNKSISLSKISSAKEKQLANTLNNTCTATISFNSAHKQKTNGQTTYQFGVETKGRALGNSKKYIENTRLDNILYDILTGTDFVTAVRNLQACCNNYNRVLSMYDNELKTYCNLYITNLSKLRGIFKTVDDFVMICPYTANILGVTKFASPQICANVRARG